MQVKELNNERFENIKSVVVTTVNSRVYKLMSGQAVFPGGKAVEAGVILQVCKRYNCLRFVLSGKNGPFFTHKSERKIIKIELRHQGWTS